jgi:hypothetical protein
MDIRAFNYKTVERLIYNNIFPVIYEQGSLELQEIWRH